LERGGKRSATPLWIDDPIANLKDPKRRRRFALPAHSKIGRSKVPLVDKAVSIK